MAHLRLYVSDAAFDRLRALSGHSGRAAAIEAGLILEAQLMGVTVDPNAPATTVSIQRLVEANQAARAKP